MLQIIVQVNPKEPGLVVGFAILTIFGTAIAALDILSKGAAVQKMLGLEKFW